MDSGRGVFIVIEGTDGSGKGTQFKLLADRLAREGYDVATFDFPQYERPSSYFVREYLNGKYGGVDQVGPYTASLFYALDRFEASGHIRTALQQGKVVLANRFVGSSMAHQGTKFAHAEERRGYFIWLDNLEFEMLRIPRPNFSFVLRVPPDVAQSLVDQKGERSYTDRQRDIHEADLGHLAKAAEVYDDMCQLFPKDFIRVDCTREQKLLSIETVHDILWQKVEPMLPTKAKRAGGQKPAQAAAAKQPAISESAPANLPVPKPPKPKQTTNDAELSQTITEQLEAAVTSLEGKVYALNPSLAAAQAAAIIAQLSHRSDDLRARVLESAQEVLSVENASPHLVASYSVIEGISLLASKKLEWSRAASYIERPPRLAAYDQKNTAGRYRYVIPQQFTETVKEQYCAYMDQIFNLYTEMVRLLAHHLRENSTTAKPAQTEPWEAMILQEAREQLRGALPVAASTDIAVYGTDFALESVLTTLLSDSLPEARQTGEDLLRELRKAKPGFLAGDTLPATVNYRANQRQRVREIAKEHLPANYADPVKPVRLASVWPRNEFDLIPDMLYAHSDLPLSSLQEITAEWPYDRKLELFEAYTGERQNITQRPGRAFEKAHYTWDLLCDFDTFRDLQRHRYVDNLDWQELTPRYGYDIPKAVEAADLIDQYEACFELSLRLHGLLQEAGYSDEAQYATLLGHKLRWQVTYNAREAFHVHELRSGPHNRPEVRELVQAMHDKLCDVHPLIGEAMRFATKSGSYF
ncbi:MAG TPA: FAD-dependent thymidylate synthase [Candidatus Saccharimonadales bacterium]